MNDIDPHAYTVMIKRVEVEGESYFEATVRELPDVRDYGDSYQEAYDLAIDTINTAAEMYSEEGRAFPAPSRSIDDYSGRVTLRLMPEVHYLAEMAASENNVSLNHYINTIVSFYVGHRLADTRKSWAFERVTFGTERVEKSNTADIIPIRQAQAANGAWR